MTWLSNKDSILFPKKWSAMNCEGCDRQAESSSLKLRKGVA